MKNLLGLAVLFAACTAAFAEDKEKKDDKPLATIHTGHYEKNKSGLKGDKSFLYFDSLEAFEKVFGTTPPLMGGGRKPNPVTKETFEKNIVVAVITRADAMTTYSEVSAKDDGGTLKVDYKAETEKPGTATFAAPLILTVPAGKIKKVEFKENGKDAGKAEKESK